MNAPKAYDLDAAFDWGLGIGEVRYYHNQARGSARGTYLRGALRKEFERGLALGFATPRAGPHGINGTFHGNGGRK